jgi:putative addiction module component (TIGR02574 family)
MSTETLDRVRSQMTSLSGAERAELALELIASLDEPADGGAAQAWDNEITRRISMVRDGEAELLTRDELRRKVRERLGI